MISTIVKYTGLIGLVISLFVLYNVNTHKSTTIDVKPVYVEVKNILPPRADTFKNATVKIETITAIGTGSIFNYIGNNTYQIITAKHVVEDVPSGTFVAIDFPDQSCKALGRVDDASRDWPLDIAVVEVVLPPKFVAACHINVAKTLQRANLSVGDRVFYYGHPALLKWSFADGYISSFNQYVNSYVEVYGPFTVVNIAGTNGSSGSSVYTRDGKFVGIISMGLPGTLLIVPSSLVCQYVKCR